MPETRTRHLIAVDAVSSSAAHPTEFQRSVAVVIGINDYRNGIPHLRTPISDATRLAQLLADEHGYDVHLLIQDVTRAALTTFFSETLPAFNLSKRDRLLLYFAGHGIALDGEDGPAGYLIPQDARPDERSSFLLMTELHGWLSALDCRHVLAILDCCFAGAFRWAGTRYLSAIPEVLHKERYERFIRDPAWQVLTSAAYDQKALDVLTGNVVGMRNGSSQIEQPHSPFALALFAALAGAGDVVPKGSGDGVITATELYLYLRDSVEVQAGEQIGHRQTPGLWPLGKHDKGEYIFLVPEHELNLPPAPALTAKNNPYRGLQSYNEEHADLFFGRQVLIEALARQVETQPLIVVLGASGTGKSSLVKAGLLPYLRHRCNEPREGDSTDEAMCNTQHRNCWHILPVLRPTESPLQVLTQVIELLQNRLAKAPDTAQRDLLVVDQFEEVITLCRDEGERTAFLDRLAELLTIHGDRLHLILTLRSDFEPQFATTTLITRYAQSANARFIVPPMNQAELRAVIEGPARVRVLFFDPPKLVDTLIDEVIQTPGALPLLSFTLEQLYLKYLKRQAAAQKIGDTIERALTQQDYDALGGVIGSLRTRADEEYRKLPNDAHRATMQRVMLRMVAVEGGELARRRVPRRELLYQSAAENARVEAVIDKLVAARLLVTNSADVDGNGEADAHIEPAHDALVRAWDRLRRWQLAAEQELPLALHRNLTQVAGDWERAEEKAKNGLLWDNNPWLPQLTARILPDQNERIDPLDYLLDPSLIFRILVQVTARPTRFNQQEIAFIQQSARRRTYLWRRTAGITLAVMIVLAGIAGVAEWQRQIANAAEETAVVERDNAFRQARIALAGKYATQTQTVLAETTNPSVSLPLMLAMTSVLTTLDIDGDVTLEADAALRLAVNNAPAWQMTLPRHYHGGLVRWAVFSPDGQRIASAGEDNSARLWDLKTGQQIQYFFGHNNAVNAVSFSPDGQMIVTAGRDRTARVWNVESGATLHILNGHTAEVTAASFDPDGKRVITAGSDQTTRLWDVETGQELATLRGHLGAVTSASFHPKDRILVTTSEDQTARLWDVATGRLIHILEGHTAALTSAAFSPSANWVATASRDATVRIWDTESGQQRKVIEDFAGRVMSVAFSPNGELLTTTDIASSRIWRVGTERQAGSTPDTIQSTEIQMFSYPDNVFTAFFSPDGEMIVTTDEEWDIRVWHVSTGEEVTNFEGHVEPVTAIAISPDDKFIVSTGRDYSIRLWDTDTGRQLYRFPGSADPSGHIALSPDGKSLVTAMADQSIWIWDLPTRAKIGQIEVPITGVSALAFSPDGERLAISEGSQVRFWDAALRQELGQLSTFTTTVSALAFSMDGALLATVSGMNVQLWDAIRQTEIGQLRGHTQAIHATAFAPNGQIIATASADGTVRLWDVRSQHERGQLIGNQASISTLAFSHDGRLIATGGSDSIVRLWDAQAQTELFQLAGHGEPINTLVFDSEDAMLATASSDETIRLWNTQPVKDKYIARGHTQSINTLAVSQDGKTFLTGSTDNTARLWDMASKQQIWHFDGHGSVVSAVAYNPNQQFVATGSWDKTTRFWDLEQGNEIVSKRITAHKGYVTALAFSPDGKTIVIGEQGAAPDYINAMLRAWDVESGQEIQRFVGHHEEITAIAYSPDGKTLATTSGDGTGNIVRLPDGELFDYVDRTIRLWDVETGQEIRRIAGQFRAWDADRQVSIEEDTNDNLGYIHTVAFSSNGRLLVTGQSDYDASTGLYSARLWDVESGEELDRLYGHTSSVDWVSFSPDGKYLLTTGGDKTIRIWDMETKKEVRRLDGHTGWIYAAIFSPDGRTIISASGDNTVRIWPDIQTLLAQANALIQREPPIFYPQERNSFGIETQSLAIYQNFRPDEIEVTRGSSVMLQPAKDAVKARAAYLEGNKLAQEGNLEAAVVQFTEAIHWNRNYRFDPPALAQAIHEKAVTTQRAQTLRTQAIASAQAGDVATALRDFQKAQSLGAIAQSDPQEDVLYYLLHGADLDRRKQHYASALEKYNLAVDLGADSAAVYGNRGLVKARLGYIDAAIQDYTTALEHDSADDLAWVFTARGYAYMQLGLYAQAIADTSEAIASDPAYLGAYRYRARAYIHAGLAKRGMKDLYQAVELAPESASDYNSLCWFGALAGYASEVLEACEQAVALADDADKSIFQDSRGLARALSGDAKGAIEDFSAYLLWAKANGTYNEYDSRREHWIALLRENQNPFDEHTLQILLNE